MANPITEIIAAPTKTAQLSPELSLALTQAKAQAKSGIPLGNGPMDLLPDRVRLVQVTDSSKVLQFDYNPEKVTISRSAEVHEKASVQAANNETVLKLAGSLLLDLHDVRFVGTKLEARMEQLLSWTQGTPGVAVDAGSAEGKAGNVVKQATGGGAGSQTMQLGNSTNPLTDKVSGTAKAPNLEQLIFTWGEGTPRIVTVKDVSISYTRFSSTGVPLAATATKITLQCYDPKVPGTNPTSGGLPGRSSHVLVTGESLVGLATATYGTPRSWRALAEANGLDDPLRLPPGREIYLPSPQELSATRPTGGA